MYESYEKKIADMSNKMCEAIYTQVAQQNKVKEYQQQIETDRSVIESSRVTYQNLGGIGRNPTIFPTIIPREREDLECWLTQMGQERAESE